MNHDLFSSVGLATLNSVDYCILIDIFLRPIMLWCKYKSSNYIHYLHIVFDDFLNEAFFYFEGGSGFIGYSPTSIAKEMSLYVNISHCVSCFMVERTTPRKAIGTTAADAMFLSLTPLLWPPGSCDYLPHLQITHTRTCLYKGVA